MSKTNRVRKPRDLRIHGYLVACCGVSWCGGRHIRICQPPIVLTREDSTQRVSQWFTKASAWVKDGKQ